MKKAIGLLGGTFDPIHNGHLRPAIELQERLNLAEVRLLPNYIPPHKATPDSAPKHRLAMARLAAEQTPRLVIDDRELMRDRPSYTLETLIELRAELPDTPLCFLMGMDAFCGLNRWHRWQELLEYTHLIVSYRPGYQPHFNSTIKALYQAHGTTESSTLQQHLAGYIYLFNNAQLDISSTQIRSILHQGNNPQYLLPEAVANYIREQRLYQSSVL
ncbi:nicotinate-nucleotide adenylyltransferase [Oceanisphaera pacifica]|uniref:Probable nicotinate-nucleotide adenylyltransferase n=1 Tax=Oceanisphaera pacifica TaxID=2818389 RepID=A0ABS3ND31_9GAMM|nr:nicotinate-nucleotide adenylyltransferase [Oceanisphaera pacifica]MBO1518497.1 nicotinate-nucleotide adenylyltransferase [Oceanisphaera pacifica]